MPHSKTCLIKLLTKLSMPRPKTILQRIEADKALRAHNCQSNKNHRIESGDARLKVAKGRSFEHYCMECAVGILERDISKLKIVLDQIRG